MTGMEGTKGQESRQTGSDGPWVAVLEKIDEEWATGRAEGQGTGF